MTVDISVVVTAHGEGNLLHRTLRCLEAAAERAAQAGLTSELLVVADRASDATLGYLERSPVSIQRILPVDHGSVGSARMDGVHHAQGEYATIIDGDDLVSLNWIQESVELLRESPPLTVVHPEITIAFGEKRLITHHKASTQQDFDLLGVLDRNPWTSTIATETATFDKVKYDVGPDGLGYEDWHLLTEVLALRGQVAIAPQTCKFYRVKTSGSRFAEAESAGALLPRSSLFDPHRFPPGMDQHGVSSNLSERRSARTTLRSIRASIENRVPTLLPMAEGTYETAHLVAARLAEPRNTPDWLVEACREVHSFEPDVSPSRRSLRARRYNANPPSRIGIAYKTLCEHLQAVPTHVLVVPWLKRGGADLESIHYARILAENSDNTVVLLATHPDAESPWSARLPDEVQFIPFGEITRHLAMEVRIQLLGSTLVQWSPSVVHNINSQEAWEVFVRHGSALSNSNLFASVFCADRDPSGAFVGYPFDYLPSATDHLTGLFSDNAQMLEVLDEFYSLGSLYRQVHYQPAPPRSPHSRSESAELRVLWAGRLDRQRRPDVLGEIASRCSREQIHVTFDYYGEKMLDRRRPRMPGIPNLHYRGKFDQLLSIPLDGYDVFLNTSQWDGMPNVLLEAASVGLPIISSSVGGIPELIEHSRSGFLVDPFDNIDGYMEALEIVIDDRTKLEDWATNASETLRNQHTWDAFKSVVVQAPNYL